MCLCAGWCGTCRDYRALFDALAQAHPEVRFEWVDIEDESELAGDLDVETFPTLLIADGRKAHFLGPLPPQAAVLERLLTTLRSGALLVPPPTPWRKRCLTACVQTALWQALDAIK